MEKKKFELVTNKKQLEKKGIRELLSETVEPEFKRVYRKGMTREQFGKRILGDLYVKEIPSGGMENVTIAPWLIAVAIWALDKLWEDKMPQEVT